MTTNADIIRRAFRLMGVIGAGQSPTGNDQKDGMERLQTVILDLPGLTLNGRWCEVIASTDYTAKEGERVTASAGVTVTLPTTITNCGPTRPPKDLARVQVLGGDTPGLFAWVAAKGAWQRLDELTIGGDFPFGSEDVEGLAALLAVSLADEYGDVATVTDNTRARSGIASRSLRSRFKAAEPNDPKRPDDRFYAAGTFEDYA